MKISDTLYFTNSYLFLGKIWTPFSGKFGNPNRPPCKVGGDPVMHLSRYIY